MKRSFLLPNWPELQKHLIIENVKIDSGWKARHTYIYTYFIHKALTLQRFKDMLYLLMTEGKDGKPLSKATLNKYILTGKYMAKLAGSKVLDDLKGYDIPRNPITIINSKIMQQIAPCYIDCRDARYKNQVYQTAIYTLALCGLRIGELCNLKWTDYNGIFFQIYHDNKIKTSRKVPVPEKLRQMLDKLPRRSEYIFGTYGKRVKPQTINEEIKNRCIKLGLTKYYTAKDFRSSFVTHCAIKGGEATLPKIARIAGHSMETAYRHYLEFDMDTLLDALQASHPMLSKSMDIDTTKRVIVELLKRMVDMSKYNVALKITPKKDEEREILLS